MVLSPVCVACGTPLDRVFSDPAHPCVQKRRAGCSGPKPRPRSSCCARCACDCTNQNPLAIEHQFGRTHYQADESLRNGKGEARGGMVGLLRFNSQNDHTTSRHRPVLNQP